MFFGLLVIPGIIFRKLYFFSEFSRQYGQENQVIKTIFLALIPGSVNAITGYFLFDNFFIDVDLGAVIDSYKDFSSDTMRYQSTEGTSLELMFRSKVLPFLGFIYSTAIILGVLSGRCVRYSNIDAKLKLLRFQNKWFYMFSGHHRKLPKFKSVGGKDRRFLFTQADILVDTNSEPKLYSGIVLDYELQSKNCDELSKVILKNASRYSRSTVDSSRSVKPIPGNFLVVDCHNLININLTYVYGESTAFLKSR